MSRLGPLGEDGNGGMVEPDAGRAAAGAGRGDGTAAGIAEASRAAAVAGGGAKFAVVAANRCGTAELAADGGKAAEVGRTAVPAGVAEVAGRAVDAARAAAAGCKATLGRTAADGGGEAGGTSVLADDRDNEAGDGQLGAQAGD